MINDNTILSSFNDRPTLLEWLKKVEDALKSDTAKSISVDNPETNVYIIKITFADGRIMYTEPIRLPDSVKGVSISNNHLVITMQSGLTVDLGVINPYAETIVLNSESNTTEIGNNAYVGGNFKVNGTITAGGKTLNAVEANPAEDTTETLSKIKIGNTAYAVGGGVETLEANMEFDSSMGGNRFRCRTSISDEVKSKLINGEIKVISGSFKYENGSTGYYYVVYRRDLTYTTGKVYEGVDIKENSNKIEKYLVEFFAENSLNLNIYEYTLTA